LTNNLIEQLKNEFSIPDDWAIEQGPSREKERSGQCTETIVFTTTSPCGEHVKSFTYTSFINHKGEKTNWSENKD